MKKKIIAIITCLSMVFGISSFIVCAATTPKIVVGNATAKAGETVSVDVSIENNPGINTFSLGFNYDTSKLSLTGVKVASELGGQFTYAKKAVWLNSCDTTYNGKILTLTFTVLSTATAGNSEVSVTYSAGDISNYNEDDVDFSLVAGKITVSAEEQTTQEPTTEEQTTVKPASTDGVISVSSVTAKAGETAELKVSIDKNPGINTFSLGFNYDTTKLTLTGVKVASGLGGQFTYAKKAVWLNSSDSTYTGEILTLTFNVSSSAASDDYPVAVTYAVGDISNYDEDDVNFVLNAGKITVITSEPTTSEPTTNEPTTNEPTTEEPDTTPVVSANLRLTDAKAKIGQTVTMKVSVENAALVKSFAISNITYNTEVFELVGGKWLLENSAMSDVNISKKNAAIAFSDATDVNKSIFELTFKVKEGAKDGNYNVTVSATAKNGTETVNINNGTGVLNVYSYVLGDTNGDEVVTSDDAIYLLYNTLMPDMYPVNQDCDFDGDGSVTSDDAIYLLYYTLMPDLYPLEA